jgi:uncharacterized protein
VSEASDIVVIKDKRQNQISKGEVMATGKAALNTPCWTELGTADPEGSKAFYTAVFGWSAHTDPNPEAGGYTMMQIGAAPVAAITPLYTPGQPTAWSISLAVADADAAAASIQAAGGTALMPPMDVFDLGRYSVLADPGGAVFAVWQAKEFAGAELLGEPNSLGWVELSSRDAKQAAEFYAEAFGWEGHPNDFYTEWSADGEHFGGMMDLNAMDDPAAAEVPPHWKPYFSVEDVDQTAARAVAAGATTIVPPNDVPGEGPRICVLMDPQGATFGIFRPAAAN